MFLGFWKILYMDYEEWFKWQKTVQLHSAKQKHMLKGLTVPKYYQPSAPVPSGGESCGLDLASFSPPFEVGSAIDGAATRPQHSPKTSLTAQKTACR